MAIETTRWDTADYLNTKEDIAGYLDAVLEDGDALGLRLSVAASTSPTKTSKLRRRAKSIGTVTFSARRDLPPRRISLSATTERNRDTPAAWFRKSYSDRWDDYDPCVGTGSEWLRSL
jgi:hypothetical protein